MVVDRETSDPNARKPKSRHRTMLTTAVVAVVAFAIGAATLWAVSATMLVPPADNDTATESLAIEVIEMTVGRSLTLNVTVSQPFTVVGFNDAPGKITRVAEAGEVASGDVLYDVDARPVVAVDGTVPFHVGGPR